MTRQGPAGDSSLFPLRRETRSPTGPISVACPALTVHSHGTLGLG